MNRDDRPWYDQLLPEPWDSLLKFAILICAGVLLLWGPTYRNPPVRIREENRRMICASNLKQISLALELYAADHGGYCPVNPDDPTPAGCFRLLEGYAKDSRIFCCASDPRVTHARNVASLTTTNVSYGYMPGLMWHGPIPEPIVFDRIVAVTNGAAWATNGNHKAEGGNVLYTDGEVRWVEFIPKSLLNPNDGCAVRMP